MKPDRTLQRDTPAAYQIRLQGTLDSRWSEVVSMRIDTARTPDGHAVTTLEGELPDQAALLGVLNLVYELGLPLLAVECEDFKG